MRALIFAVVALIVLALFFGFIHNLREKKAQDSTPVHKNSIEVKIEPIKPIIPVEYNGKG